ncbi:MAG: Crp/Fnr family transcriptional regulator [Muribaculaceae bacterium]|nr:Crp/Fnr family transcriptional regulator [Muribaculaceae bacterium]
MFETLIGLPLFKGASMERMEKTVGSSKFHFLKYLPDTVIYNAGDPCTDVTFILSGKVKFSITNSDKRFSVSYCLDAREVLSPDFLFGRHTNFPATITAVDTVSILRIPKTDYVNILESDKVFLFNYLNILSVNAQKAVEGIIAVSTGNVPERIAYWISVLTQPRAYSIVLECRRRDLSALFGVHIVSLKNALESMHKQGLLDYTPMSIVFHDRSALLALLHNHSEPTED